MLIEKTKFKGSEGKMVDGVNDFGRLKGKRLEVLYNKLKKEEANNK